jgi:hypothetical protein
MLFPAVNVLSQAGVQRSLTLPRWATQAGGGEVGVQGSYDLRMSPTANKPMMTAHVLYLVRREAEEHLSGARRGNGLLDRDRHLAGRLETNRLVATMIKTSAPCGSSESRKRS